MVQYTFYRFLPLPYALMNQMGLRCAQIIFGWFNYVSIVVMLSFLYDVFGLSSISRVLILSNLL